MTFARRVLSELGIANQDGEIALSARTRLKLAMGLARVGGLREAARALNWDEFEMLAEDCLFEAGYEAQRNVRVSDGTRGWQIDVVGLTAEMALCFDCKHWNSPSYPSKFTKAATHQTSATRILLRTIREKRGVTLAGLPILLTLFEPRRNLQDDVVLVPIQKLPDFLANLTLYSADLPFIIAGG